MSEEKKKGFLGRLGKKLSSPFQRKPKTESKKAETPATTPVRPPSGETSFTAPIPVIRSESAPFKTAETIPPSKPLPEPFIQKKPVLSIQPLVRAPDRTVHSKPLPKKKKRKRHPNGQQLQKAFRMGQYLSKVRQRKKKIKKKGLKKAVRVKKIKIRRKTRLAKKAVEALRQEMKTVSPGAPLEKKTIEETEITEPASGLEMAAALSEQETKRKSTIQKTETGALPPEKTGLGAEKTASPEEEFRITLEKQEAPEKETETATEKTARMQREKEKAIQEEIESEIKKQRGQKEVGTQAKEKPLEKKAAVLSAKKAGPALRDDVKALQQLINEKFSGQAGDQQIRELQQKVRELLEQRVVTRSQVEENIRTVDANRLLEGFTKLLSLIDVNDRSSMEAERVEMPSTVGPQQKPEKMKGIEKELEKKELITDFDKILEVVRERGTITLNELAAELNLDKRMLKEAVDILEENNLVVQEFPAFGAARIMDPAYLEKKAKKGENA